MRTDDVALRVRAWPCSFHLERASTGPSACPQDCPRVLAHLSPRRLEPPACQEPNSESIRIRLKHATRRRG